MNAARPTRSRLRKPAEDEPPAEQPPRLAESDESAPGSIPCGMSWPDGAGCCGWSCEPDGCGCGCGCGAGAWVCATGMTVRNADSFLRGSVISSCVLPEVEMSIRY